MAGLDPSRVCLLASSASMDKNISSTLEMVLRIHGDCLCSISRTAALRGPLRGRKGPQWFHFQFPKSVLNKLWAEMHHIRRRPLCQVEPACLRPPDQQRRVPASLERVKDRSRSVTSHQKILDIASEGDQPSDPVSLLRYP
jgi:hypothetical protein